MKQILLYDRIHIEQRDQIIQGLDVGVVDSVYFTAVILLIVVSSVATPLVLKALFTKMPPQLHPSQAE